MLIMIHSELAFSLLEALFNGPTHDGGFTQLRERYIDGRIGEGEFSFPIRRSSDEEPYRILLGQSISGWINAEAGHFSGDRPLSAFGQGDSLPVAFTGTYKHLNGFGLGLTGRESRPFGLSAPSRIGRDFHVGLFEKDLGIGAHISKVVEALG
jgi:hypothetical protein